MYHALDIGYDSRGLVDLVYEYQDETRGMKRHGSRSYMFIDEISSVTDWQKAIKYLWDQGSLRGCTVIATGSHAADIRKSPESMPGRRGETDDVLDKVMSPMSFAEYAALTDPSLGRLMSDKLGGRGGRRNLLESVLAGTLPPAHADLSLHMDGLNRCLYNYMLSGGVPKIVDAYWGAKSISDTLLGDYRSSMTREFGYLRMDEGAVLQLVKSLLRTAGRPVTWSSLTKNTEIGSEASVIRYVKNLGDMMYLHVLYGYDHESKGALYRKSKKVCFLDPFFHHVLSLWANGPESDDWLDRFVGQARSRGILAEGIVASHLLRMSFARSRHKLMYHPSNFLYHWRCGGSRKVDFVYNDRRGAELPIEVKFQSRITRRDLDGVINFKKRAGAASGIVLTRDKFSAGGECLMIPAAAFLILV